MVQIGDVVFSLDIFRERFVCDLDVCRGCCCVEGEAGAPLQEDEAGELEKILPIVWDDLSPQAREVIRRQGVSYRDGDGDQVTSIVNGKDCVFTCYDRRGYCICAIQKAYKEGKTDFYKPISCHLYPIRVGNFGKYKALNYHKWSICHAAWDLGKQEGVPVYQFLKEPLIRKFGKEWYEELELVAGEMKKQGLI